MLSLDPITPIQTMPTTRVETVAFNAPDMNMFYTKPTETIVGIDHHYLMDNLSEPTKLFILHEAEPSDKSDEVGYCIAHAVVVPNDYEKDSAFDALELYSYAVDGSFSSDEQDRLHCIGLSLENQRRMIDVLLGKGMTPTEHAEELVKRRYQLNKLQRMYREVLPKL